MNPSIIKGWDTPKTDYIQAHDSNELVKLVIELSNVCNLSCSGCFTKRVDGGWGDTKKKRLPNEMSFEDQVGLLEEAAALGASTVDIVGAGEPTLDSRFSDIVDVINALGMYSVVFTHGVSKAFEDMGVWKEKDISFFIKLWSRDSELQDRYVSGSIPDYSKKRDETIVRMVEAGFTRGTNITVDRIAYQTTRLGADILVMNSNYGEIVNLFDYCRANNIMPEIKTYIPEGPTRFDQAVNVQIYSPLHLAQLKTDEVSLIDFAGLRKMIVEEDLRMHGINNMNTFYPQSVKCTQSMASLYVTVSGDIRSCVGTHVSYGTYERGKGMLRQAIKARKEKVGFGCVPRLEDAQERGLPIDTGLKVIYGDGMR